MRRMLRLGALLLAVLALVGSAVLVTRSVANDKAAEQPSYVTASVERRTLRQTLVVRGTIKHQELSTLRLAGTGRVTAVGVKAGGKVSEGQQVLAIDGRPVIAVKGSFPFWRDLRSGDTGKDVRQLEQLLDRSGYDPGTVDERFRWSTEVALRKWQKARGYPVDGVLQTSDTLVTPLPARVGSVNVEVGDFVSQGTEVATVTGNSRQVDVELAATDRLKVKPGQAATVEISATGDTVDGTVGEVSTVPAKSSSDGSGDGGGDGGDEGSGQGDGQGGDAGEKYAATVTLKKQPKALDGTDVRVTIILAEERDVLAVPVGAVVLDDEGNPSVRVLTDRGRIDSRKVKTGMSDASYVAVASGVAAGETVVLGLEG